MNYSAKEVTESDFRSGMIALAGRPNVGKSTLLNRLLERKVSITSKKANTTRHRIMGILNEPNCQFVFIDLPGFSTTPKRLVDRSITKTAASGMAGTDLVIFVVESRGWQPKDAAVWNKIRAENLSCVIALTKIDKTKDKNQLLPVIADLTERTGITDIVPVSAVKNDNIDTLKSVIFDYLPPGPPLFPPDIITDKDDIFWAAESIREQIFRYYGNEIPYVSAVQIERFEVVDEVVHVDALVWVETRGQKRIIIGSKGAGVKRIGVEVRKRLEPQLERKVFLNIWVKVRAKWTENQQLISNFGLSEVD